MRRALPPAPKQRGGADQRDYSRKNAGQTHLIPQSIVPAERRSAQPRITSSMRRPS
jgi:hypothetical protein